MQLHLSPERSYYEVTDDEKHFLMLWRDTAIAMADPEDVTEQFFIANFVIPEKWRETGRGVVNAFMKRYAHELSPGDVTNVVVEKGEIFEGNPAKGIFLNIAEPTEPETYFTRYDIAIRQPDIDHPRYTGRVTLTCDLPAEDGSDLSMRFNSVIKKGLGKRMHDDHSVFTTAPGELAIEATTVCDATDKDPKTMTLIPKPLTADNYEYAGLASRVDAVGSVLGIDSPDFLMDHTVIIE